MTCTTHIVDCLQKNKVYPEAYASSDNGNPASNALVCDSSTWYRSKGLKTPQWWAVNFKRRVSISKYILKTLVPGNNARLYNWTLSVSFDNSTWNVVHGPTQSYDDEKTHTFNKPVNTHFVRIDGNSLSSSDQTYIYFKYIKFIGSLNANGERNNATCKKKKEMKMNLIRVIFFIYS